MPGSSLPTLSSRMDPSRSGGVTHSSMSDDRYICLSANAELLRAKSVADNCTSISSSLFRACNMESVDCSTLGAKIIEFGLKCVQLGKQYFILFGGYMVVY